MKPAFIVAGVLASLAGMIVLPAVTATDSEPNLPAEIAVTFSGSYEEIVIRNQQRARKEEHPPTWIDAGPTRSIQNWIGDEFTTPGIDGRLAHFAPPREIQRDGDLFVLVGSLGPATRSDGRQTQRLVDVPHAVPVGNPPEGYLWDGAVRQKELSQVVSWVQDWRYRRVVEIENREPGR